MRDSPAGPIEFVLPPKLEAREPPEERGAARDEVRLLVSHRRDDKIIHAHFPDLPRFLYRGDLLVANDSKTLPVALTANRADGSDFTLHLSTQIEDDLWTVEPRQTLIAPGEAATLPNGASVSFLEPYHSSTRLWLARLKDTGSIHEYLALWGKPIRYSYMPKQWPIEAYQTLYAREPGSAEMPSAGRPFSNRVIESLTAAGIDMAFITLHTGVASLERDEPPYEERFEVRLDAASRIEDARQKDGRIIAVGTTVLRALETAAAGSDGRVSPAQGWTDLVITERYRIRTVDGLLTGFHEPKASHLAVLEAFAGRRHIQAAYAAALQESYLWHEFGDVHLIL